MREQTRISKKVYESNALSSAGDFSSVDSKSTLNHNQQLHELVLKKQKLIIYLSIFYSVVVLGVLIYLFFIK